MNPVFEVRIIKLASQEQESVRVRLKVLIQEILSSKNSENRDKAEYAKKKTLTNCMLSGKEDSRWSNLCTGVLAHLGVVKLVYPLKNNAYRIQYICHCF